MENTSTRLSGSEGTETIQDEGQFWTDETPTPIITPPPENEHLAWCENAERLADYYTNIVSRQDVWGGYLKIDGKWGNTTHPARANRGDPDYDLRRIHLVSHFKANDVKAVVGLHTTAPNNTCKLATFDIDNHQTDGGNVDEISKQNKNVVNKIREVLDSFNLPYVLTDSDGKGGFHLDLYFSALIDSKKLFHFQREVLRRAGNLTDKEVEAFPKQPVLELRKDGTQKLGNWVRLPGRHHKRDHWSKVWDAKTQAFYGGQRGIEIILATPLVDPNLIPDFIPPEIAKDPPKDNPIKEIKKQNTNSQNKSDGVIEEFNSRNDIEDELRRQGYINTSVGKWKHPHGGEHEDSVSVEGQTAYHFSPSDTMYGKGRGNNKNSSNAFTLRCVHEYGDDVKKAVKELAAEMKLPPLPPKEKAPLDPSNFSKETPEKLLDGVSAPIVKNEKEQFHGMKWWRENTAPKPWLIKHWLTLGDTVSLWGPTGSCKSFFALDMALSISYGVPFAGERVRQGTVFYVYTESLDGAMKRCDAWKREHGKTDDPENLFFSPYRYELMTPEKTGQQIVTDIKALIGDKKVDLIIIDTLSKCFSGDENSGDIAYVEKTMAHVRDATGATVMVVHHTGHNSERERGHSSFRANVDHSIGCKVLGEEVTGEGDMRPIEVSNPKAKEEMGGRKAIFERKRIVLGTVEDEVFGVDEISSLVLIPTPPDKLNARVEEKQSQKTDKLLNIGMINIPTNPTNAITKKDWSSITGTTYDIGEKKLRGMLATLIQKGWVEVIPGNNTKANPDRLFQTQTGQRRGVTGDGFGSI